MAKGEKMHKTQHFFFNVVKLHRLWTKEFGKRLSGIGMTHGLAAVLLHLELLGEGSTQREIAESMEIEQPTLVALVERLEELALLTRRPYPGDRRKHVLMLTPKGRKLLSQIADIYESTYQALFSCIDGEQMNQIEQLLARIYSASKS
tara:strand:+ start:276 stop:719 length:444 start_codon:yes stop_codon:yes gene_type:complete